MRLIHSALKVCALTMLFIAPGVDSAQTEPCVSIREIAISLMTARQTGVPIGVIKSASEDIAEDNRVIGVLLDSAYDYPLLTDQDAIARAAKTFGVEAAQVCMDILNGSFDWENDRK